MRRVSRVIAHPGFAIAVLALMLIDFVSIPATHHRRSRVKYNLVGDTRQSSVHPPRLPGIACNSSDGVVWLWEWDPRFEAIGRSEEFEPIRDCGPFIGIQREFGFYHLTTWSREIHIFNEERINGGREALIEAMLRAADHPHATNTWAAWDWMFRTLRAERTTETRPIITGYIRNAIALTLLALLLISLCLNPPWRWLIALHRTLVEDMEHRRRWQGLCPGCAYPLKGLKGFDRCPECGRKRSASRSAIERSDPRQ